VVRLIARAALVEIFDSVQGEGRFVGVPMAFLRVATCPLRCSYCDTPHSYSAGVDFPVVGSANSWREPNPVSAQRAAELVRAVAPPAGRRHPLSLTGGEPLVYPRFLLDLGEALGADYPLHLETAAIDPVALAEVLPVLRHLSADYKLPETVGGVDYADRHVACVDLGVRHGVTVDVKVVMTPSIPDSSFTQALARLAPWRDSLTLILQPVTPFGAERATPAAAQLRGWLGVAQDAGFTVRVIPQVHKVLALP
jgi:7-carboxy-7-deazaguanine synthase